MHQLMPITYPKFCSLRFQYGTMGRPISVYTGIDANSKILNYYTTCVCCNALNERFNSLFQLLRVALKCSQGFCFCSTPQEEEKHGSGLCGDHSCFACKIIQILFSNNVRKWAVVACAVRRVASGTPSCTIL